MGKLVFYLKGTIYRETLFFQKFQIIVLKFFKETI